MPSRTVEKRQDLSPPVCRCCGTQVHWATAAAPERHPPCACPPVRTALSQVLDPPHHGQTGGSAAGVTCAKLQSDTTCDGHTPSSAMLHGPQQRVRSSQNALGHPGLGGLTCTSSEIAKGREQTFCSCTCRFPLPLDPPGKSAAVSL